MTTYNLANLDQWALKSAGRMEAVAKQAIQDMTDDIQRPRASGGRMPVDTGFLRNSAGATLDGANLGSLEGSLIRMQLGDAYTFGWGANYARFMNNRYGFLDLPVQDWSRYVFQAVQKVKR